MMEAAAGDAVLSQPGEDGQIIPLLLRLTAPAGFPPRTKGADAPGPPYRQDEAGVTKIW
jgi:hypothetical protein